MGSKVQYHHWFYSTKLGAKIQARKMERMIAEGLQGSTLKFTFRYSEIPYTLETLSCLEQRDCKVTMFENHIVISVTAQLLRQLRGLPD